MKIWRYRMCWRAICWARPCRLLCICDDLIANGIGTSRKHVWFDGLSYYATLFIVVCKNYTSYNAACLHCFMELYIVLSLKIQGNKRKYLQQRCNILQYLISICFERTYIKIFEVWLSITWDQFNVKLAGSFHTFVSEPSIYYTKNQSPNWWQTNRLHDALQEAFLIILLTMQYKNCPRT